MSKIVKAINVMVSNPNLITNVLQGQHEMEIFLSTRENTHGQYSKIGNVTTTCCTIQEIRIFQH